MLEMVLRTKNGLQTLLHYIASINGDHMYLFGIKNMYIDAVFYHFGSLLTYERHSLKH